VVYTDASQSAASGATFQIVGSVLGRVNLEIAGRGPAVVRMTGSAATDAVVMRRS